MKKIMVSFGILLSLGMAVNANVTNLTNSKSDSILEESLSYDEINPEQNVDKLLTIMYENSDETVATFDINYIRSSLELCESLFDYTNERLQERKTVDKKFINSLLFYRNNNCKAI